MRKSLFCFLILLSITFNACGEPKIDTSTDESMKTSIEKVKASLPESQKSEFDEAITLLTFSQVDLESFASNNPGDKNQFESKLKTAINGKTAVEIIAEGNRIKIEREKRQKEQAIKEIYELEQKRKDSILAKNNLKKFKVLRSRFYKVKQKYIGEKPVIELTVKNETNEAISRAYFKGTIASPKRSIPWFEDSFNYSISGGLEPGEEDTWQLAPNMFSDWGKVDAPADAIFTVTVERLDGADGKPLYSNLMFGEYEKQRLDELKDKYNIQ